MTSCSTASAPLEAIPAVLVQGILDLGNLLGTPWDLAHAWSGSKLVMIDDVGHDGGNAMSEAVVAATDELAAAT
jgi:proline iminopeptidase